MKDVLLFFAVKYHGDWDKIYAALERKEPIDFSKVTKMKDELGSKYITILDQEYPNKLKQIYKPPFVIFYKGNLELITKNAIAVIGTRNPSEYGIKNTEKFVKELSQKEYTIVSGMAKGIDSIAHLTAINEMGKTIAVLGSGINYVYPKQNEKLYKALTDNHLVISEYPNAVEPQKENFKSRNRIVSALARGVLVIEAAHKSGTMNTVTHALEQGKDIFCIPNKITELSGTNLLIKQGAKLVERISDITDDV